MKEMASFTGAERKKSVSHEFYTQQNYPLRNEMEIIHSQITEKCENLLLANLCFKNGKSKFSKQKENNVSNNLGT